ncbi:hypothetical protein HII31_02510 [Pseudocercospora fuligena]|uniref:Uncharacterized protein n=1 Tax=Pseudocercospora fuligena TaxID=685502 RepID=A0A8H6VPU5_9PEZI|nr:hypothetical protein HII31_02510 [Pseudocercospora fuligena]
MPAKAGTSWPRCRRILAFRRRICSAQAASSGCGIADPKTMAISPITCVVGHNPAQGNGPFHAEFHPASPNRM